MSERRGVSTAAPKAKRKSPCRWISWDEEGRPSCVHGPARKNGFKNGVCKWACVKQHRERRLVKNMSIRQIMRQRARHMKPEAVENRRVYARTRRALDLKSIRRVNATIAKYEEQLAPHQEGVPCH